jgi:uncharacterized protein
MKLLVWGILFLLVPVAFAQEGTIPLLALAERSDGSTSGAVANLDLEIEPGSQRVFLETFPLTKITTQISMRFAQQVACKELDIDCSEKDFFFTVRALPGIVGGPSAGSAAAVLAASMLTNLRLRNDTAITGTINSGGVIGAVGGVKQKIEAAAGAGFTRVLIPRGTKMYRDNDTNETTDLVQYGKLLGLDIIEVSTLQEALHEYTGRNFPSVAGELVIEPRYQAVMKAIAVDLCDRTTQIKALLESKRIAGTNTTALEQTAVNMSVRANNSFTAGQYYAAASFCFRSNVLYKQALALQRSWNQRQTADALLHLNDVLGNFSRTVDTHPTKTITDVQTYMAVHERISEVGDSFVDIARELNNTEENPKQLAYAEERLYSAVAWSRFFDGDDKRFVIDSSSLRDSCLAKLAEAEERINYVLSFLPDALTDSRRDLVKAYVDLGAGNYTLCLLKASKTKAEADVILALVGVDDENIDSLIDLKLGIVRDELIKSQKKGIFPMIGYSYYEYAQSLKPLDKYSAVLFSEYALELSNIDMYFPKKRSAGVSVWRFVEPHLAWVAFGLLLGLFIAIIIETYSRSKGDRRGFHRAYK